MRNRFFKIALAQATRLAGKPGRMLQLVGKVMFRLHRKQITVAAFREKLNVLVRLTASYARGHYRVIPLKPLISILAALLYFLNPLDLIPDAIFGVGLMDDLAVLTWVYSSAQQELEKFAAWETTTGRNSS